VVLGEPGHRPSLLTGEGRTNRGALGERMEAARFREAGNCRVRWYASPVLSGQRGGVAGHIRRGQQVQGEVPGDGAEVHHEAIRGKFTQS
jgi:hypothetical protein